MKDSSFIFIERHRTNREGLAIAARYANPKFDIVLSRVQRSAIPVAGEHHARVYWFQFLLRNVTAQKIWVQTTMSWITGELR